MSVDPHIAQSIDTTDHVANVLICCKHGKPAAKHTSKTAKNLNREFYCCKRQHGDPSRCNFWHWADDPVLNARTLPSPSSPLVASPSVSSRMEGTVPRPSTPQTSSPQKQTPRSAKRLLEIEEGLRQRDLNQSPTRRSGPSKLLSLPIDSAFTVPSDPTSIANDVPFQPPSPVPTEVDETEERPRKTYSFLGLEHSPEPRTSTINELPSTPPKKRRLTPPGGVIEGAVKALAAVGPTPVGPLPTPPKTTQRVGQPAQPPVFATNSKGKGREDKSTDDHAYPNTSRIGDSGGKFEDDALPLFTDRESSSASSGESPTIAENVLDYTDGLKTRVKALSTYMDSFDITQAGKILQTVERQKIQYEFKDHSQKTQIQELIVERDRLRATVTRLETALLRSEERNRIKDAELEALRAGRATT